MANLQNRISNRFQPIKDAAAIHGRDIGTIGTGTLITIDYEKLHDGWVPILGPGDLGPTWKATGKQGWIEYANTEPVNKNTYQYLLTVSSVDGSVISFKRVA